MLQDITRYYLKHVLFMCATRIILFGYLLGVAILFVVDLFLSSFESGVLIRAILRTNTMTNLN